MNASTPWPAVLAAAHAQGDRIGALRIERLPDLLADFTRIGVDATAYFSFVPPDDLGYAPRSVLIVASPSALACVHFQYAGRTLRALLPATYADEHARREAVHAYLAEVAARTGHRVTLTRGLPCKPIAVHAGIGQYGRCDTVFLPGLGSFANLSALYSDIPVEDAFLPLTRMERCRDCDICRASCPSGAIPDDMSAIDMERCLTNWNERPGDFPDWVRPEWHNALVGCMRCQGVCPENAGFMGDARVIKSFGEEDTARILEGGATREEFEDIGLAWYAPVLGRNLRALVAGGGGA